MQILCLVYASVSVSMSEEHSAAPLMPVMDPATMSWPTRWYTWKLRLLSSKISSDISSVRVASRDDDRTESEGVGSDKLHVGADLCDGVSSKLPGMLGRLTTDNKEQHGTKQEPHRLLRGRTRTDTRMDSM